MPGHGPRKATSRPKVPRPRRSPEQPDPPAAPGGPPPPAQATTEDTVGPTRPPSALVVYLTDPDVQAAIDAFVSTAPPLTEAQRVRLARLLRTDQCTRRDDAA